MNATDYRRGPSDTVPHAAIAGSWALDHATALLIDCPTRDCGATAGDPCINVMTGETLRHQPAHYRRTETAKGVARATATV